MEDDPKTYDEAMNSIDASFWREVVSSEMDSVWNNKTWYLTDLPHGRKTIGCKWIFRKKLRIYGTIEKFKVRLVAKGFKQKEGVDFFDTYSPITRITTIRMLIALASIFKLELHQMDVKTTFLNSELNEEIYMDLLEGFVVPEQENKVCRLVKSLYGLKQAPKQQHKKFDKVIKSNGFLINDYDKCVYLKVFNDACVILYLYVDDILIFGKKSRSYYRNKNIFV